MVLLIHSNNKEDIFPGLPMINEPGKRLYLRVINWNISYQLNNPKTKLLKSAINEVAYPCIVALEEVSEVTYRDICDNEVLKSCIFSLDYRKPGKFEGRERALGCLVACVGDAEIVSSSIIERAPFPERTLSAKIRVTGKIFELVCFHSLVGIAYGKTKSAQFAAITDYLHDCRGRPVIFCGDAEEPKVDHYDLRKTVFFDQKGDAGKPARTLLGSSKAHNLKDAYRIWLTQSSGKGKEAFDKIKRYQDEKKKGLESSPLAVSHISGGKKKRYDYLFVSPDWDVDNIEYRYAKAIVAGSNHAMLVADLQLGCGAREPVKRE